MSVGTPSVGTVLEETPGSGPTAAVPYPPVVNANDWLVLAGSANSAALITNPAGYNTPVVTHSLTSGGVPDAALPNIFLTIKKATGSETGTLAVTRPMSVATWFQMLSFPGVDGTTPQDVAASYFEQTTTSFTIAIPGVTIATPGAALVAFGVENSTSATATPPTGFTETGDLTAGTRAAELSYILGLSTGATGAQTITFTGHAKSMGVLLALRPAATIINATATLTGAGVVTVVGGASLPSTASIVASGTVTATGLLLTAATATLTGTSTVTAAATGDPDPVVTAAGGGTPTYRVTLRDATLASVGEAQWTTVDVVARFNAVGTWIVELPTYVLPLIGPGGGVIIRRDGNVLMSGPYTSASYTRDSTHPDGSLTLSGVSDDVVLQDRLTYPDPAHAITGQTTTVDHRTGAAETVIYAYVNANAGPGALAARRVAGLTLASDLGRGVSVDARPNTGSNVLTLSAFLANYAGLGFRTVQVGGGLQFQVYLPNDYSTLVRFSWPLNNATALTYVVTAPQATREIAHNAATYVEVADAASETTWGRRIEHDVAGSANNTTTLTQDGNNQLVLDKSTTQLTVAVLDTHAAGYGSPWGLGDKVTVIADVAEIADVVREIHFHADSTGEVITPTVGTPGATAAPATSQAIKDLITHVSRLEGNV